MARAAKVALVVAALLSSWAWAWRLDDCPPWVDYDSATLGIFVNNVSFHDDYAHGFRGSRDWQAAYRADWAAQFLPASVVLSALQRGLGLGPEAVGDLLEAVALALGALGTACVVSVAMRARRATWEEGLFVAGLLSSLPPFLLYLRTVQPHFLFSFLAFWVSVASIDRYLDGASARALAALAVAMAAYLLLPYVPIVVLPVTGLVLALGRGKVRVALRDPRLYAAAAASVALAATTQWAVAVSHEGSWEAWRTMASRFVAQRTRHAWPLDLLDPAALGDKAAKLLHQHFWFQRDLLGDRTRLDLLWTLPEPHVAWLLLVPVALLGAWTAWRARDAAGGVFAAVLVPTYAVALTAGLPEGRYLLTAVPCLAWFTMNGLRALAGRPARPLLLAAVLVATTANSWVLVRGDYNASMTGRWQRMAGQREAVDLIRSRHDPRYGRDLDVHLHWPGLRYEESLYQQMLWNMRAVAFDPDDNLAALAPGRTLFAAVESGDQDGLRLWKARGFRDSGEVVDRPTGRRFVVLYLPP